MAARTYRTIALELVEFADIAADHFDNSGYRVYVEKDELGFPYTPTFLLRRRPTTIILEVANKIEFERLADWARYCKSCGTDTRVAVCLPHTIDISAEGREKLRDARIGLYVSFKDRIVEQLAPADLALNVQLPELAAMPQMVRELLGSTYDQFARTHWREGFEDACQVVETEARRYLKKWSKTGRIKVLRKGSPATLSATEINRMTMGQLAVTFDRIQAQTHADSTIHKLLAGLNNDRIGVAHHKKKGLDREAPSDECRSAYVEDCGGLEITCLITSGGWPGLPT